MSQNEIDKFFGDLPGEDKELQDVFNEKPTKAPAEGEVTEDVTKSGKEDSDARKNRRHRRLEEQLLKERESNIALNERIKVLAEVRNQGTVSTATDVPAEWIALYGDTPEARTAWSMQERLLQERTERVKQETIAEIQAQQQEAVQAQKEFESFIDSELESLEDEHNVDLTSNSPAARKSRREFLELVQKVSPKDGNGNVTSYADFPSTFELYQSSKTGKTNDRQKELASKTMQTSAPQGNQQAEDAQTLAWLRSQGIKV